MKEKTINLYQLPENWEWATIGEVCTKPQYGYTTKASKKGTFKLLRTTDITAGIINWREVPYCHDNPDDSEKYLLKDGDIVISRAGSVGYSILIDKPERSVFASYLIRFRPLLDRYFFSFFLQSPFYWGEISDTKSGIALANVNAKKLQAIPIPLPPLPEQHRIVAKIEQLFSELDKGVAELKKAREKLELYRQSLLKAAFEGRLTEQWRRQHADELESAGDLLARIRAEREKRYRQQLQEWQQAVEHWQARGKPGKKPAKPRQPKALPPLTEEELAELPELPEGWGWMRLLELTETIQIGPFGSLLHKADYVYNQVPVINPSNIKADKIIPDSNFTVTSKTANTLSRYRLNKGDIILGRRGEMGRCAVVTAKEHGWLCGTGSLIVRLLPFANPSFYSYILSSKHISVYLEDKSIGTTMQNLNQKILQHVPIPVCSKKEQVQIISEISALFSTIDHLSQTIDQSLQRAEALRQSILKKAFSGQLVPQDPNDEPASELLKRIRAEQEKAAKEKKPARKRRRKKESLR